MPPKTLGIVHTSFALVGLLNTLAKRCLPDVSIVNIVDDTLLGYARVCGVDERLNKRMAAYFASAVAAGADIILNACSTVGETVDSARETIAVPILKIDEAMAEKAVTLGKRIGIFATVSSTLGPTRRLIEVKAAAINQTVVCSEVLCAGGFDLLLAGDTAAHDELVTNAVLGVAQQFDVLVFAQASMSTLAPAITAQLDRPLLSSPDLAMARLKTFFDSSHFDELRSR